MAVSILWWLRVIVDGSRRELEGDFENGSWRLLWALRRLRCEEHPRQQDNYHITHNFDLFLLFSIRSCQHFPVIFLLIIFILKIHSLPIPYDETQQLAHKSPNHLQRRLPSSWMQRPSHFEPVQVEMHTSGSSQKLFVSSDFLAYVRIEGFSYLCREYRFHKSFHRVSLHRRLSQCVKQHPMEHPGIVCHFQVA